MDKVSATARAYGCADIEMIETVERQNMEIKELNAKIKELKKAKK